MPDDAEVSYTVKELLEKLDRRIGEFMSLLSSKADQTTVALLAQRVDKHEIRITELEHDGKAKAERNRTALEFRRWLVPVCLSVVPVAILVVQVFHL